MHPPPPNLNPWYSQTIWKELHAHHKHTMCRSRKMFLRINAFPLYGNISFTPRAWTPELGPWIIKFRKRDSWISELCISFLTKMYGSTKEDTFSLYGHVGPILGSEPLTTDHISHNLGKQFHGHHDHIYLVYSYHCRSREEDILRFNTFSNNMDYWSSARI